VTEDDTIAAIATAAGVGGVGIVRVSGPRAIAIVAETLGVTDLGREVRVGWARGVDGARVDQVIAFAMRAPASFTGEDVAEVHGHGGTENLRRLLGAVVARGARIAEPGEFTRRAVANGKLDLIRAEALLEVIHAGSERAWRLAQENLGGRLGAAVVEIEQRALELLAEVEGRIDFPDDELDVKSDAWLEVAIASLVERCAKIADGFRHGRALAQGVTVALVGAVNVGKSSLLNALVGKERALVAAEPGTTRDYLEVRDVWAGVTVTIVDTAGTRETPGAIEARGIALGEERVASADVVVVVNDGEVAWDDGARYGARALLVRSKADLGAEAPGVTAASTHTAGAALATSAVTGAGLDELRSRVLALAGVADREGREDAFVTTARQQGLAAGARDAFAAALAALRAKRAPELVAVDLRQAVQQLAQLRGVEVGERVLDEVFARFCIGK
jgi:tRNA modification GTPase